MIRRTMLFAILAVIPVHAQKSDKKHRLVQHVRLIIPKGCITQDVVLDDCDLTKTPPKCKKIKDIHHSPGCEQVQIVTEKEPKDLP